MLSPLFLSPLFLYSGFKITWPENMEVGMNVN